MTTFHIKVGGGINTKTAHYVFKENWAGMGVPEATDEQVEAAGASDVAAAMTREEVIDEMARIANGEQPGEKMLDTVKDLLAKPQPLQENAIIESAPVTPSKKRGRKPGFSPKSKTL